MDYLRLYDSICNRAIIEHEVRYISKKNKTMYFERHHIIPRCIGGTDDKSNIVLLTAKEHYMVHKLLCEIYPDNIKVFYAFWNMCNKRISKNNAGRYSISSKVYNRLKEEFSIRHSNQLLGRSRSVEAIEKQRRTATGKPRGPKSLEHRLKISESLKGRTSPKKGTKLSIEHREKLKGARVGYTHSEETRNKLSSKLKGKKKNPEAAKKSAESRTGMKQQIVTCPHCNKTGGVSGMKHYHFDNCKHKNENE